MHSNEETLRHFYTAFNEKNADVMADSYHAEAVFSDPVFDHLQGDEIGMMWKMLCLQASTLEITAENIQADDEQGSADWTARYNFGKARREVNNCIHAKFNFKDGKIIRHTDDFNFWKWSFIIMIISPFMDR